MFYDVWWFGLIVNYGCLDCGFGCLLVVVAGGVLCCGFAWFWVLVCLWLGWLFLCGWLG